MAQFVRVVFLQGDDYENWETVKRVQGEDAAMDYLMMWDHGDNDDLHESSSAGPYDSFYYKMFGEVEYRMTWNAWAGYVGLERVLIGDETL